MHSYRQDYPPKKSTPERLTIGLFIENTADVGEGYLTSIRFGIMEAVQTLGCNMLCFVGGALNGLPDVEFDSQRNILYSIPAPDNLDGLIIISSIGNYTAQKNMEALCARYASVPMVSIGTPITGTMNVTVSHRAGMRDALVHLIEVHHYRRIAFIRGPADSPDAEIRYAVYREVLAQYEIPFDPGLVVPGFFRFSSGGEAVQMLLDERQVGFDVLVAANDHMALGALEELQARGVLVPYDVAVIGFDNIPQARNVVPPLTTVRQPLQKLGREAVNLLWKPMANKQIPEPEQMILATELVIRRSCGCMPHESGSRPVVLANEEESLARYLKTQREMILAELAQVLDFSELNARMGTAELLDSFYDEVINDANGRFLATIDKMLRAVVKGGGNINSWQRVVPVLRRHIMAGYGQDEALLHAGNLLHEVQIFITGEIRNIEAQLYLQINWQNWLLHDIGQQLITTFELEGLKTILREGLPQLGVPACYLVLYEEPQTYHYPQAPPLWSRLILAFNENGRMPLPADGQQFRTSELLPANILPKDRRYTMMIEPLYFREEHLGYVLLEKGPREGNVYEVLRGQIASGLKGALLLQAHMQAEEELRQHRDHLDELIQERTRELATANAQLKQEVEERRQTEKKLQESQKNLAYAQTIAQLGYSYWIVETGEFVWSEELYRIFDVDKDFEISGKAVGQKVHPDDRHLFIEAEESRKRGETTQQLEFRLIGPQGNVLKYIYLWGETTFADDGKPVSVFSIFQDITVRRLAELKLEAYTAELERSNKELQDFAYVASHDLQEPLRKIHAFGERLQQRYYNVLDEKGQNYIDRMQNAAERMQALIVDLLAFSRVRTHPQPFEKVDLTQIVTNVLQDLEIGISDIGATITVADLPILEADPVQMRQLFQNLLGNALKFYRPEIPLHITVNYSILEPYCEITVADNGIGFEQQYAERIFNVFERLHGRDLYAGTGMGLAICRRIAERHGGDIRAEGRPEEGATFIVRLLMKQPTNDYLTP